MIFGKCKLHTTRSGVMQIIRRRYTNSSRGKRRFSTRRNTKMV